MLLAAAVAVIQNRRVITRLAQQLPVSQAPLGDVVAMPPSGSCPGALTQGAEGYDTPVRKPDRHIDKKDGISPGQRAAKRQV